MSISLEEIQKVKDITKLKNKYNIDESWSLSNYKLSERRKWTHGYHHYTAKYIPQLVEKIIDDYRGDENLHINDPFYGSGTTIVTAISKNLKASGTDINKIAHLITKTKSTPLNPDFLNEKITTLTRKIKDIEYMKGVAPLLPIEHLDRINYWFNVKTIKKLCRLLRLISEENNKEISNFYKVAFSHILKACSYWLKSSTKPQIDSFKEPVDPYIAFMKHLIFMKKGNNNFYNIVSDDVKENLENYLNITNDDARKQPVNNNSVDMVISSSPYVISYDYASLHQLSTIWLYEFEDMMHYRKKFIGTPLSTRTVNQELKSSIAIEIVNELKKTDNSLSNRITKYYNDMLETFNESNRILKKDGLCCYIIGNTLRKGITIRNVEVFIESLLFAGFEIEQVVNRKISNKFLPQLRDINTGRFTGNSNMHRMIYPNEYIIIARKT